MFVQNPIVPPVPQQATLLSLSPAVLRVNVVAPDRELSVIMEPVTVRAPITAAPLVTRRVAPDMMPETRRVEPEIVWIFAVVKLPVVSVRVVMTAAPKVAAPITIIVPLTLRFWKTVDIF